MACRPLKCQGDTELKALQVHRLQIRIKTAIKTSDLLTLRVQVPNNHILTQNMYYNYYYPNPKYQIIGYMDPLGNGTHMPPWRSKNTLRRLITPCSPVIRMINLTTSSQVIRARMFSLQGILATLRLLAQCHRHFAKRRTLSP